MQFLLRLIQKLHIRVKRYFQQTNIRSKTNDVITLISKYLQVISSGSEMQNHFKADQNQETMTDNKLIMTSNLKNCAWTPVSAHD